MLEIKYFSLSGILGGITFVRGIVITITQNFSMFMLSIELLKDYSGCLMDFWES